MRRILFVTLVSLGLVLGVLTAPASAIRNGELDGDDHPFVGIMVAQDATGAPLWRCSGTLLSSTLFLTAGHCTDTAEHVEIWFDAGPVPLAAGYPAAGSNPCAGITSGYPCQGDASGTPYTHPDYDDDAFYLHDLGVVVLDQPVTMDEYGALPELDQFDDLAIGRKTRFTSVGYGMQRSFPDAAGWKDQGERTRMVARPQLKQINKGQAGDYAMILSANANTGGTCFGDSGGPNFIGTSNVIAGVTSFAMNQTCAGTAGIYRVDKADDLDWLYGEFSDHL